MEVSSIQLRLKRNYSLHETATQAAHTLCKVSQWRKKTRGKAVRRRKKKQGRQLWTTAEVVAQTTQGCLCPVSWPLCDRAVTGEGTPSPWRTAEPSFIRVPAAASSGLDFPDGDVCGVAKVASEEGAARRSWCWQKGRQNSDRGRAERRTRGRDRGVLEAAGDRDCSEEAVWRLLTCR